MNCDLARKKFPDALYGELPSAADAEFAEHLTTCESCRQELDALRQTTAALDLLPTPLGRASVTQVLRSAATVELRGARRWRRAAVAAVAASLLIGAFAALGMRVEATTEHVTLYFGDPPTQAPQAEPVALPDPWSAITQQADDLERLGDLVRLVVGELQSGSQRQQQQLAGLRRDTAVVSHELALRWALLRQDLDDMYAFQYPPGGGQQGDQP